MILVAALVAAVAVLATYWIMKSNRGAQQQAPKLENGKGVVEMFRPSQKKINPANMAKGPCGAIRIKGKF